MYLLFVKTRPLKCVVNLSKKELGAPKLSCSLPKPPTDTKINQDQVESISSQVFIINMHCTFDTWLIKYHHPILIRRPNRDKDIPGHSAQITIINIIETYICWRPLRCIQGGFVCDISQDLCQSSQHICDRALLSMPACNLLPSLRKFTARHIWTLTAEAHFTNNATLNYISGFKLVVAIISRFKFCISCIFHLYSCKKILAHTHLLAQGCIFTV